MRHCAQRKIKLIAAAIFVVASFAGLQAMGQAPSAPAVNVDSSKLPDIEGVHLGMSEPQAMNVMTSLFPGAALKPRPAKFANAPDKPWITRIEGTVAQTCSSPCSDQLAVILSMPPNPQQVVSLERGIVFLQGKEPTLDAMLASLRQKYGQEVATTKPPRMGWLFDEQGRPLAPSKTYLPDCADQMIGVSSGGQDMKDPISLGGVVGTPPITAKDIAALTAQPCRSHVYIRVELLTYPIQGVSVVTQLHMYVSENDLDTRDAIASQQYLDGIAASQKQQQLKHDQQVAAPKL
jgi:hypothetical protein